MDETVTYVIEDVTVTNMDEVITKFDETFTKLDNLILQIQDIQIYFRIIVYVIFFFVACYVANWLWKTWIRGLIRAYFKLPI